MEYEVFGYSRKMANMVPPSARQTLAPAFRLPLHRACRSLTMPHVLSKPRSMTSDRLGRRRLAEHQVADKSPDRDGEHDPAVVRHEEQPMRISF